MSKFLKPIHVFFWLAALSVATGGCAAHRDEVCFSDHDLPHLELSATEIEYPDVESLSAEHIAMTPPPVTLNNHGPQQYRDMTLEEAIRTALANARVMRDLGVLVLNAPENIATTFDPSIAETDPVGGVDAALSEFDAQLEIATYFENNDRALNNVFFGGGTRLFSQDLHHYRAQVSKRSAVGSEFTLRHNVEYDFNNSPGNDTPNRPWDVNLEAEVRQPLLQRAGVEFNRIAGPYSTPGRLNGVLLARVDTDISLTDFEIGVRDLVRDVENAYWELYFSYRDLDAKVRARDRALETWRRIHNLYVNDRRGGEAEKEAQAREQYFRSQEAVQNALSGRKLERSRPDSFRGTGGVYVTERRLRKLMGIAVADGTLIRPADEPAMARIVFDWSQAVVEAMTRRAELRQQKWRIKRRELELIGNRNFLKPSLDAVGRYRWRGLGSDLLDPNRGSVDRFDNAYGNMTSGDFQEWQLGVELSAPIGYRRAHAAVRNSELRIARERAVLKEQEQIICSDLAAAVAEMDRAYQVAQTNYNRRLAAMQQLAALETVYENADLNEKTRLLDLLLDAQRRVADAESQYYRSTAEYALAVRDVHYEKGSLLDYSEVFLSEGPWPGKAYFDAASLASRRGKVRELKDFTIERAHNVSLGPYPQDTVTNPPPQVAPISHAQPLSGAGDRHPPPVRRAIHDQQPPRPVDLSPLPPDFTPLPAP